MNNNIDPIDEVPANNELEPEIPPAVEYDAIADQVTAADDVVGDGARPVKGPK